MTDSLVDRTGVPVDANSIYGRLTREAQDRIDATLSAWFGNDTEPGRYNEDAVKELGKHSI